jgi:hypothetical protein
LFDGNNWHSTSDFFFNRRTNVYGVDGGNFVGSGINSYEPSKGQRGFLYDGTNMHWFNPPEAEITFASDMDENLIVGHYQANDKLYGFLYDGVNWTTLDVAGSYYTYAYGIDGDKIVGYYTESLGDSSYVRHGFIYTIPEPATLLLVGIGAVMIRRRRN